MRPFLKGKFVTRKNVPFSPNGPIGANVPKHAAAANNHVKGPAYYPLFRPFTPNRSSYAMDVLWRQGLWWRELHSVKIQRFFSHQLFILGFLSKFWCCLVKNATFWVNFWFQNCHFQSYQIRQEIGIADLERFTWKCVGFSSFYSLLTWPMCTMPNNLETASNFQDPSTHFHGYEGCVIIVMWMKQ